MLKKCGTIVGSIVHLLQFGVLCITNWNLYFVLNGDRLFLNNSFSSCLFSVKNPNKSTSEFEPFIGYAKLLLQYHYAQVFSCQVLFNLAVKSNVNINHIYTYTTYRVFQEESDIISNGMIADNFTIQEKRLFILYARHVVYLYGICIKG